MTCPWEPGENTVIVTPIPGDPLGFKYPLALIAAPTKLSWVMLLTPPGGVKTFSSYIEIDPGINPPPTGIQYLSPGLSRTLMTWYCCPIGIDGPGTEGSPRFGSAWFTPRYRYLSLVNCDCGVFLDLPLKYFAISYTKLFSRMLQINSICNGATNPPLT